MRHYWNPGTPGERIARDYLLERCAALTDCARAAADAYKGVEEDKALRDDPDEVLAAVWYDGYMRGLRAADEDGEDEEDDESYNAFRIHPSNLDRVEGGEA